MRARLLTERVLLAALALLAGSIAVQAADSAQSYPSKPIHLIVGFAAGGGNDIIARVVAQKMFEGGQPVVVENKPGGGGIVSADYVAHAAADGYTLLVGATGAVAVNPVVYETLPYDVLRDFAPITNMVQFPLLLTVKGGGPIASVKELVAAANANPAKSNYAAPSASFQLVDELFKAKAGIKSMEYVAYKSTTEGLTALMSGEVLMAIIDPGPAEGLIKSNQVRGLAVTSDKRMKQYPDIPTMAEAGIHDMNVTFFSGLFAPKKTDPAIVKKVQVELARVLKLPDVRQRFDGLALDPVGDTPEDFTRRISAEIKRWTEINKAAKIKLHLR